MIDDEYLSLQYLGFLFSKIEGVHVTGAYTEADDLINHVQTNDMDAVFMDIQMPGIDGIQLAEQLLSIDSSIHIIFITGHNSFGAQAFELNALDYILKPVELERLEKTIHRIINKQNSKKQDEKPVECRTYIKNLGTFQIYQDDKRLDIKWRTSKTKELFAYFIQNHEYTILKRDLTNLMWEHLPWEKANSQLYSTVYEIRKMTKKWGISIKVISLGEFYNIRIGEHIEIESFSFKHAAQRLIEDDSVSMERYFAELERFQGDYLAGSDYSWALVERKIIKGLWFQLIHRLIEHLNIHESSPSYQLSKLKDLVSFDSKVVKMVEENGNLNI